MHWDLHRLGRGVKAIIWLGFRVVAWSELVGLTVGDGRCLQGLGSCG